MSLTMPFNFAADAFTAEPSLPPKRLIPENSDAVNYERMLPCD